LLAILVSVAVDSANAVGLVPVSVTDSAPVAVLPLLVTTTVCAAGAELYPAVALAKVIAEVGDIDILGVAAAVTVKLTVIVR